MDYWKFLTILVAVFASYVSWSQYSVNKEKFKLDLFEKRFLVFEATRKFLSIILRNATFEITDLYEFRANTSEADFLFNEDILKFLNEIDQKSLSLWAALKDSNQPQSAHQQNDYLKWLNDQLVNLKPTFSPYMKFKTWK